MVPSLFSYTWPSLKSCTSSDSVGGFACNIWVQWHSWLDGGQYKEIETREQIVWWAQTREPNLPQQPIVADAFFFLGLPSWIFKSKTLLVSKTFGELPGFPQSVDYIRRNSSSLMFIPHMLRDPSLLQKRSKSGRFSLIQKHIATSFKSSREVYLLMNS